MSIDTEWMAIITTTSPLKVIRDQKVYPTLALSQVVILDAGKWATAKHNPCPKVPILEQRTGANMRIFLTVYAIPVSLIWQSLRETQVILPRGAFRFIYHISRLKLHKGYTLQHVSAKTILTVI